MFFQQEKVFLDFDIAMSEVATTAEGVVLGLQEIYFSELLQVRHEVIVLHKALRIVRNENELGRALFDEGE